jgi:hypothetical protein
MELMGRVNCRCESGKVVFVSGVVRRKVLRKGVESDKIIGIVGS